MSNKPETKEYYTVKLEALAPITITYRVLASSPEEALELAIKGKERQSSPTSVFYTRMKKLKATVYAAGTSMIQFTKGF